MQDKKYLVTGRLILTIKEGMNTRPCTLLSVFCLLVTGTQGQEKKPLPGDGAGTAIADAPLPEVSAIRLQLDGENGPGRLFVTLAKGQPPQPWQPEWPALNGPLVPVLPEGKPGTPVEYTAPIQLTLAMLKEWDHPPNPPGLEFESWLNRFAPTWPGPGMKPLKYTVQSPLFRQLAWPLNVNLTRELRLRQFPLGYPIIKKKSLLVTDLHVLQDQARTWDPAMPNAGNPQGEWTFHHLVSGLANGHLETGRLVRLWLETLTVPQPMGAHTAAPRDADRVQAILDHWPKISGSATLLDTQKAPFRLLAIVNRFDLRESTAYGGGSGSRAELRFVFCYVAQPGEENQGMGQEFYAIFEYGVPLAGFSRVHQYALNWAKLSRPGLSEASFRDEVAAITGPIVAAGASPARPNGSNLNQLRTSDLHFADRDLNPAWEMREFRLMNGAHHLKPVIVAKTPEPAVFNNTDAAKAMRKWIHQREAKVIAGNYTLPRRLDIDPSRAEHYVFPRAASSLHDSRVNLLPLELGQPCAPAARLAFIKNTCVGCHSTFTHTETLEAETGWNFMFTPHVSARNAGALPTLSQFLFTGEMDANGQVANDDLKPRMEKLQQAAESAPFLPLDEMFFVRVWQPH